MLTNMDGTPLESTTKWYNCDDESLLSHQQLSFLKWINPFGSNSASKSNSSETSSRSSETFENDSYRGVQGLTQFWNDQITATKDNKVQKAATLAGAYAHRTSSQELIGDDVRCGRTNLTLRAITPKRSQSLHDSEEIPENHINNDNFYKYKTASSKKRCTLSLFSDVRKPHSFGVNFPLVVGTAKGEKIHWAKREDIIAKLKREDSENTEGDCRNPNSDSLEKMAAKTPTSEGENAFAISEDNMIKIKSSSGEENKENNAIRTCDNMAIKSSPGDKRDSGGSGSNGGRSQSGDSTNSLSCESPVRKTNATSRKCSFKTHSKNYYTPRKMTSGSKVAALTYRFNQLIQQDAAILEEVKRNNGILMTTSGHIYKIRESGGESSKKKSSKGSGTDDEISSIKSGGRTKLSFKKRSGTPTKQHRTPRESPSKASKDSTSTSGTMTVKETIKKFETSSQCQDVVKNKVVEKKVVHQSRTLEKPKVPTKSEVVLQRTKEVAHRNSLRKNKMHISTAEIRVTATQNVIAEIEEEEKSPGAGIDVCKTDEIGETSSPRIRGTDLVAISISVPIKQIEDESQPILQENANSSFADSFNAELLIQNNLDNSSLPIFSITSEAPASQEETQSKKSKYARLYEKFRFKSPFASKKSSPIVSSVIQEQVSIDCPPDQKIVDALETVNKKLEHLSKSTNDIRDISEEERLYQQMTAKMKPNDSFLFRNNFRTNNAFAEATKDGDAERLVEAVNTRLINKTQSMDESWFPSLRLRQISFEERDITSIFEKTDELLSAVKSEDSVNDELYEPIASPEDIVLEDANKLIVEDCNETNECIEDNIYQTLAEVKNAINRRECDSMNSYESYGNYESVEDVPKPDNSENSYEICDPPEPPPPRKVEPEIRINNEPTSPIPALPLPKRIISNNNPPPPEVDYSKIPPRPPKSPRNDHPNSPAHAISDRFRSTDVPLCLQASFDSEDDLVNGDDDNDEDDADENIYDIIKHSEITSHCYESITSSSPTSSSKAHGPKSLDTISMMSNCYESISSLRRIPAGLHHSDSISTLSSDQKTNSLYGMTLGQAVTPPSEGASDNSDDWVTDLSEDDEEEMHVRNGLQNGKVKQQFIVVRERAKYHRSPDWSKKVRDQRTHCVSAEIDDDSDHLYEPLYHRGGDRDDENLSVVSYQNGALTATNARTMPLTDHHHSGNCYSDEYDDSFSDEDTDEEVKKNDSGVDISNVRLPDPPSTANQVYAFVKKIKNFGSLSKSLSKISMRKSTPSPKVPENNVPNNKYENTQFYVGHDYQNTNFESQPKAGKQKTPKTTKKGLKLPKVPNDDPYENTEFHTPRTPKILTTPSTPDIQSSPLVTPSALSQSDKSLSETVNSPADPAAISRKKSKSSKSFKSKFRKSLAGPTESSLTVPNAFNATRSTFYISDSVDVDSGIFEKTSPHSEPNLITNNEEKPTVEIATTVVRKTKKILSSPELHRRRTTIGIRPTMPPPPPPVDRKANKQKHASTTSWYTECGVFKPNDLGDELSIKDLRADRNSSSSWYTEAGLYHTSGASVASSSGSSGVSTGGEGGPGDDHSHSMFLNEPLYQIYSAAKLQSITDIEDQESTDGYEEIGPHRSSLEERKSKRPSAFQLIGPKQGPSRTLWSEIPEVQNSGMLTTLSPLEKRLQEAKFEILTSEASYLKSLNLLKKHFMGHPAFRDTAILGEGDRKTLFYSIIPVQECSDRLLCDLENCWQDNIMLLGLSKSIYKHAEKYFHVYVSYCENQGKMDRTLRRLKEEKGAFSQQLEIVENEPECCSLNLHSFLMLPMQRITRLPLLIDAVFSKLQPDDDEYEDWKLTLGILNKIVTQCNEAANRYEQAYEIERISRQIEFPSNIRSLAIAPVGIPAPGAKPRSLVKKGELVQLIWRGDDGKLTFGKKFVKCNIYAFLFTDLLVLTKRKGEQQFVVFDYCLRSMLTVSSGDVIPQLPTKDVAQAGKNLMLMTLLENYEGKTVELILSCPSVSERQRWLEATKPLESEDPNETLYEQWDCPQVLVKHEFTATEPDMLSLQLGEVINVNRKMADGWYQGERIRDGATGWFPGNFTEEINSSHVRARNLKQRHRLLTLTACYLESQRKKP